LLLFRSPIDEKKFSVKDKANFSIEGDDMIPIRNRIVINGMSERTQSQMIEQLAHSLFTGQAADRIIVARMSRGSCAYAF